MSKIITKFDPALIKRAVDRIANPVVQTLTPLGNNVLFEKDLHSIITNDGATIAKLVDSEDETEDSIIQLVKYGSLATNQAAGDGTSTTILLTQKLVHMGLDKIESGVKPMILKNLFAEMRDQILERAESLKKTVSEDDWYKIALVSASGDKTVAQNTVEIIQTAGLDGMVFLNESKTDKTKIIKDSGYLLEQPMFDPIMGNIAPGRADYFKSHVFITDKKLYHIEECREILEQAHRSGVDNIIIVARDFLGESAGFLIANHMDKNVPLNILMIKYPTPENDYTSLHDLATYLGGEVVSEKRGSLKGKITANDFILTERVYSTMPKTIFVSDNKINPGLSLLIEDVRKKKEDDPNNETILKRLASLTAGTVNLEVGASTGPELRELIYRYEDAINATRAAIRSGYVVGGGVTLFNSTRDLDNFGKEFGLASVKQIAENCAIPFKEAKYGGTTGYNAKTGKYSDLERDGVIEPFDVFKYSLINAVSIATAILTSGYFIVNKTKKDDKQN